VPDLRLAGCATRPLANFLKALGVLRLVSLQGDPAVRGRWRDGVFELRSELDGDGLSEFFLERYEPTPILSPWNGRCGFYPKGNSAAMANLRRIEESEEARLSRYRELIATTRGVLTEAELSEKPGGEDKERLIRTLRRTWPDSAVEWLDAVVVLTGKKLGFPPVLGSGGNDGSYDFSSNLMEALGEVLLGDRDRAAELLGGALEDAPAKLDRTGLAHLRRDASPTNSPWGEATALGNPWDLVLSIEGTIALAAGASRKLAATTAARPAAPFTVWSTGAGYGSAAAGESGRAELWLPLWGGWSSFAEITALAREFRAQVGSGRRLRDALTGLDLARAAGERGVALGLTAFERYALLERAGQSTLAVSTGRVEVGPRPGPRALREIDRWLRNAIRFAADDHAPSGPKKAIDRLQRRAYAMASNSDPASVCAMLEALGQAEARLAVSRGAHESLSPLRGASASPWIDAGDDGSHEFALAVAIASLRDYRRKDTEALPTVRDYLHGVRRSEKGAPEFDPGRRHTVSGANPFAILAELQMQRHLDAARAGRDIGRLPWDRGAPARLDSLRLLASGALDEGRLLALAEGLCTLRHDAGDPMPRPGGGDAPPEPMLDFMLLAWHRPSQARSDGDAADPRVKRGNKEAARLGARPEWAARLARGGARTVASDAILRLRQAGLPPLLSADDLLIGSGGGRELERSRRLSAALLPHLGASAIGRLLEAQILTPEDNDKAKDEP
jgi:CRISPR-associated protein Csx17